MFSNKDLCKLILPLVVEQILAVTIGMADTIMVSVAGEAAVSGISLIDTLNILLINIFAALATGGAVISSQYLGRKDRENASVAGKQLLLATFLLSTVLMVLCLFGQNSILRVVFGHIDADVMMNAQIYFSISAISYPFLALYNSGAALFRAMGNSKISMFTSLLMNVTNIGGNALLIYGFGMGVRGAAIASLVSRMLGAVIMLLVLHRHENPICIEHLFKFDLKPAMIKNILRIGVPNGLENGIFHIGKILVQGLVASFGTVAIAANAVAGNVASMQVIPGSAIGLALITVVGQCVGAQDYDLAKYYTVKLMKIAYVALAALNILILLFSGPIVNFYNMSPETTNLALQLLICHGTFAMITWAPSFALPNALRAANDVKFTMIVSIVMMWTCRLGLSYLFANGLGMGVLGVWVAMVFDWAFRAVVFIWRFKSGKWQNKQLI